MGEEFKVGDKVFAKIRGYPEWPALITEICSKKYKVYFYGTGEVGDVKKDCVHFYLENKHRLFKPSLKKRRSYFAAIEEIESAIFGDQKDQNEQTQENKLKRRKSFEMADAKENCDQNTTLQTSMHDILGRKTNCVIDEEVQNKTPTDIDYPQVGSNIKIITKNYLNLLIDYAKHLEKNEIPRKNEPPGVFNDNDDEVAIANSPCGKLIPVNFDRKVSHKTELEKAIYEAKLAEETLFVVESLENDLHLENANIRNDLNITDAYVDELKELELIEFIKHKLSFLKTETTLVKLQQNVREHLNLYEARPKEALQQLEEMLTLEIDALMLKKQPEVVDLIKKLQGYVGNVEMWDFNKDTLESFIEYTKEIQRKAFQLKRKFSDLFTVPADVTFWDFFYDELKDFKRRTAHMSVAEVLSIHSDPGTRQGFFDRAYEKEFINDLFRNAGSSIN